MRRADPASDQKGINIKALFRRDEAEEGPRIRRGLPPELATAVATERLAWTLAAKGLDPRDAEVGMVAQRLQVRLNIEPGKTFTLRSALQRLDVVIANPALIPALPSDRLRAAELERVLMGEVMDHVLWCLLRPPVGKGPAGYADQFMTAVTLRAVEAIATLRGERPYLFGGRLSSADIAVAAVLAPAVCPEGWTWAARGWTPMSTVAGRSALVRHSTGVWVRQLYARHAPRDVVAPIQTRAWVP